MSAARLAVGAVALACLVGFGGTAKPLSKTAYDNRMTGILESFAVDLDQLATATGRGSAPHALAKLRRELATTEQKLAAITPPHPIRSDQARLVVAIAELRSELGPAIAKLNTTAVNSVGDLKGLNDLASAVEAIVKAGYEIG